MGIKSFFRKLFGEQIDTSNGTPPMDATFFMNAVQGLDYIKNLPPESMGVTFTVIKDVWGCAVVDKGLEDALNENIGYSGASFSRSLKALFELAKKTPNFDVIDAQIWKQSPGWHERVIRIQYNKPPEPSSPSSDHP